MKQKYESILPEGYRKALVIDGTTKKFTIWANAAALLIMFAGITVSAVVIKPFSAGASFSFQVLLLFAAAMFAYIILHELVHGAVYKVLTGHKLTFGFTASVAYCGVPDIYVYRRTALAALLAPFLVFDVVFGTAVLMLPMPGPRLLASILLWVHIGGCIGDLYDTYIYLFKLRDNSTLMRDSGPKQTFYVKEG